MALHVVVGAGPVGSALARHLLDEGEQVRVVTRSGGGVDGTEQVAADASDAEQLVRLADGATAIYNCVNPQYHRWVEDWPPIAAALLTAAEKTGAVLATTGNLYVYGRVHGPMTEQTPLAATGTKGKVRIAMWQDALAAHQAGRARVFEVRGSDYLGGNSVLQYAVTPALRKGRRAWVPAALDVPHSFTDVRDVAGLLATGVRDERAWGRAWHVPTAAPLTVRELVTVAAEELGARPKVSSLPYAAVWAAGLTNPFVKELRETQHQFRAPYVLDSTAARRTFGLEPHDIRDSVRHDIANTPTA